MIDVCIDNENILPMYILNTLSFVKVSDWYTCTHILTITKNAHGTIYRYVKISKMLFKPLETTKTIDQNICVITNIASYKYLHCHHCWSTKINCYFGEIHKSEQELMKSLSQNPYYNTIQQNNNQHLH